MLGFGVSDERQLRFEHYPQSDSLSPEISELEEIDTALHTYRIHAGASDIRLYRDQTLLATLGLNTALDETAEYFPYLDVDGACSAEIRNLWASPTPAGTTQITAEDAVHILNYFKRVIKMRQRPKVCYGIAMELKGKPMARFLVVTLVA